MLSYEKEFLASERLRERLVEAEHERMARLARRTRSKTARGTRDRRPRFRLALDFVRRLARAAAAT